MAKLGSTAFQVTQSFNAISEIGNSKFSAKQEFKNSFSGNGSRDNFMAGFGKEVGVYSIGTMKDYISVSIRFANFAKTEYGVKDISKLTADHVKGFLESKTNLSKSSVQKYSAALEKFEKALSTKYEKEVSFNVKSALPDSVKSSLQTVERAGYHPYSDVKAILGNINDNKNISEAHKLAINITAETGLRLHKALEVSIKINAAGNVFTQSKGGRGKELNLSPGLKSQFVGYLEKTGKDTFKLTDRDYKGILSELKTAALATNQSYEALHGFKHSFALSILSNLQQRTSFQAAIKNPDYMQSLDHNRELPAYRRG